MEKQSSQPLYISISEEIIKKINTGLYSLNQQIPSEAEIQQLYKVSRVTARAAIKRLNDLGVVYTVHGKGSYVNNAKQEDWTWMRHFSSEVKSLGREPSSIILTFKIIPADDEASGMLKIDQQTPVFYIKRMRCVDNYPVWLTTTYIPVSFAPELSKEYFSIKGVSQSIFYVLEHDFGITIESGVEGNMDTKPETSEMDLLGMDYDSKYSYKTYVCMNAFNVPIVYEKTIYAEKNK